MKNSIDLKSCLSVYDKVISQGEKSGEEYTLEGIKAWTDFDGYNCFLQYKDVTITLMFHGKYDVKFEQAESLTLFEKKLIAMTTD